MNIVIEIDLVSIFDEYLILFKIEYAGNVSSKIPCRLLYRQKLSQYYIRAYPAAQLNAFA